MRTSNIINPVPIVIQSEQKEQIKNILIQEEILNFSTIDEYLYYVTHEVNNAKQKDGRIYLKMNNGELNANSVSPYAKKFWTNIEPGVKELVEALIAKRYLTYSSCEGHGPTFRRYVGLAFADEESREYVIKQITDLGLFGVITKKFDSVCNMFSRPKEKTSKPQISKLSEEEKILKVNLETETKYFNVEFHRNYEKYYFLEIIITDAISYKKEGVFKEIKKVFLKLYKTFFCNFLTKKVESLIKSKEFKKYPY